MSSSSTRTRLVFSHTRSKTPRHLNCSAPSPPTTRNSGPDIFSYKKATLNQSLPFQFYLNTFTALSFKTPIFLMNSAEYLQSTHSKYVLLLYSEASNGFLLPGRQNLSLDLSSFLFYSSKSNIPFLPNHPRFFWIFICCLLAIPCYLSTYPNPSGLQKPDLNSLSQRSLPSDTTINNYFSDI